MSNVILIEVWRIAHRYLWLRNWAADKSLQWWLRPHNLTMGMPLEQLQWMPVLTDASLAGWGAHCGELFAQGGWTEQEAKLSINRLELQGVALALLAFESTLWGRAVRVLSNNAVMVAYLNRQGGTRRAVLKMEAESLFNWVDPQLQALSAAHIAGMDNVIADFLSQVQVDPGEWELHPEVFAQIVLKWESPVLDLMATFLSARASRFYSRRRE